MQSSLQHLTPHQELQLAEVMRPRKPLVPPKDAARAHYDQLRKQGRGNSDAGRILGISRSSGNRTDGSAENDGQGGSSRVAAGPDRRNSCVRSPRNVFPQCRQRPKLQIQALRIPVCRYQPPAVWSVSLRMPSSWNSDPGAERKARHLIARDPLRGASWPSTNRHPIAFVRSPADHHAGRPEAVSPSVDTYSTQLN